ncbi:putative serine/threonine-protein kinase nek2 [Cucumis melo var. makuwa]|uniref:Serine/threonine-protein kinase nek2 n=1 Tax=Cucumis melo var. makuwa TaxID=1194695 RepID=A0A5A7T5J9_CUCMM|nr:putative serine/threonine-protein kinase nek2 [Cucumis melo var. makuwa]TYJ95915.1 putative serine/threonine-protein kinase nek2 [Cucumis melo var. makuwa]
MELPTDGDLTLGLDEVEIGLHNAHTDQLEQVDALKNEKKKTRGLTLMHDVTRIKSTGEKTVVEYNENRVPIGENGHKLQSFIGYCVHHHILITHASWKVKNVSRISDEILDKSLNDESPNDALSQALGTLEYGGRVRGVVVSLHLLFIFIKQSKKVKQVLENVIKEKKEIVTNVPPISLTLKKKVVEEEEVKEEEVIATKPLISKNEVKASRPMTKEVEVTSEPSNLPIQLKYILRYAERIHLLLQLDIVLERLELETFVVD